MQISVRLELHEKCMISIIGIKKITPSTDIPFFITKVGTVM